VLSEAWALYKRHAAHFILISFAIFLVISVITALLTLALGTVGALIGLIFSMFGTFLLQAALVKAVQDVRDGRADLSLGQTISAALPFLGSVAVASILASIGIGIGFVLIIVPGLFLLTMWSLIVPEIVIGGSGAMDSFGRSWRTVRGYAWNVFGTYVLVFLILIAGEIVLSLILSALPQGWRSFISSLVSDTLVSPFIAAVITLIYYRLTTVHGGQPEPGAFNAPGAGGYGPYGGQGPYGPGPAGQPPYGQGPADQPPYGQEPPTVQQPTYGQPPPAGQQPPYDQGSYGPNPYGGGSPQA
jgi:MFS family permease